MNLRETYNALSKTYITENRLKMMQEMVRYTTPKIQVKYHDENLKRLEKISIGDWIDLRAADTYFLKKGDYTHISLGVSMKLPDGYEAHIVPRSSTFKHWKILQADSIGIIDNSYSGNNDIWQFPALAMEDTVIHKNDRICQFRIVKRMPEIEIEEVEILPDPDRGGFGTTGRC